MMRHEKDELIEAIRELAAELGRTPRTTDLNRSDITPVPVTYYNHWDSFAEALEAAGIDPEYHGNPKATEEMLIEELQQIAEDLGRPPTEEEMMGLSNRGEAYSLATYKEYFGSWNRAKTEAGLPPLHVTDTIHGMTVPLKND